MAAVAALGFTVEFLRPDTVDVVISLLCSSTAAIHERLDLDECLALAKPLLRKFADAFAKFPAASVAVTGETRNYEGRHFCARCGSSVYGVSGDDIEVNLGVLDSPNQLVPTYELWTVRRESWLPPFPLQHHYVRDRESTGRAEE